MRDGRRPSSGRVAAWPAPQAIELLLNASPGVGGVIIDAFADVDGHLMASSVCLLDAVVGEEGVVLW